MGKTLHRAWAAAMLVLGAGCANSPLLENLGLSSPPGAQVVELEQNPVFIPLGPESYGKVFENVLHVLIDHGFEIQEANRYDGRIEAAPRIAPGLILCMLPGSPAFQERLLATMQTYRHRVSVIISPDENGGFFVEMIVRKELQDLPRPVRATAGAAIFRNDNTVERQLEVVDPTFYDVSWIFKGRDVPFEQLLLKALKEHM
jgi:hypothetical protein